MMATRPSPLRQLDRIATKLLLLSATFLAPLCVMLYQMVDARDQSIEFASQELLGNRYQRELERLMQAVTEHHWLSLRGEPTEAADVQVRQAIARVEAVDAQIGEALQFTARGLGIRDRGDFSAQRLLPAWEALSGDHRAYIARLRTMITHCGDTSNLILDPDLDSYYLMDVTLLGAPDVQDRLDALVASVEQVVSQPALSQADRTQLDSAAAVLEQTGIARLDLSTRTALAEDANFYGTSPSLQHNLPRYVAPTLVSLAQVAADAHALAALETPAPFELERFRASADEALQALYAQQHNGFDELDRLIDARIAHFESLKRWAIVATFLAGLVAAGIAVGIGRGLVRRARQIEEAMDVFAGGSLDVRLQMRGDDELSAVAAGFDHMAERLEIMNKDLERLVVERTSHLQRILDNVTFGFVLIDPQGVVLPGFTRSCIGLLETEQIAGRPIVELLKSDPRGRDDLALNLQQLFEDFLPEELLVEQIPKRLVLREGKTIGLEARAVRAADGTVCAALLSLSDASALVHAEQENAENRMLMTILSHRDAYVSFLQDTWAELALARKACKADADVARRIVHTVKGNSSLFGMEKLVMLIHEIEQNPELQPGDIQLIEQAFQVFLVAHERVLGLSPGAGTQVTIPEARLRQLDGMLRDVHDLEDLRKWSAEVRLRPIGSLLGPIRESVNTLADRLGKMIQVDLVGLDTRVDPWSMGEVCRNLIHVVRNAISHGIEAPSERGSKAPRGRISLRVKDEPLAWWIEIEDDGRGIDPDALKARAVATGQLTEEQAAALTSREALELMFEDGVSTASEVTSLSGRGVGLSALRAAAQAMGATIEVQTETGTGSQFIIRAPKPVALLA
jgi:signal transduction histidine kinase